MPQVTILQNGKPVTVEETSPGLFGKLGYTYVSGGQTQSPVSQPVQSGSQVNPVTGKSNAQVIQESTAAAQEAARVAGLPAFQPGATVNNAGQVVPTAAIQAPPTLEANTAGVRADTAGLDPYLKQIQDMMSSIERQRASASNQLSKLVANKPDPFNFQEAQAQAFQSLGLPANFTAQEFAKLNTVNAEIASLNADLASLEAQELQSLARIEDQPIPLENISSQQNKVQRDTAIKKFALSSQIEAKAAHAQAIMGNFQMVTQLVDKAVQYAMYEKQQEIADFRWMFDVYKSEFDSLTDKEFKLWETQLNLLVRQEEQEREDLREKALLYINNGIEPDLNRIGNMSFAEVAADISQRKPVIGTGTGGGEALSILDVARYNELYPNAGVISGDTKAVADTKVAAAYGTRDYQDTELRQIAEANKNQNTPYEQALTGIMSDPTIQNKERAKQVLDEVYGKGGTSKPLIRPSTGTIGGDLSRLGKEASSGVTAVGEGVDAGINAVYNYLFGK